MKTHILCLGDSNTHGYCADPNDCADHGIRFNEDERWTASTRPPTTFLWFCTAAPASPTR